MQKIYIYNKIKKLRFWYEERGRFDFNEGLDWTRACIVGNKGGPQSLESLLFALSLSQSCMVQKKQYYVIYYNNNI